MEYKVTITWTEVYTTYVEVEDWEEAEKIARRRFMDGELDMEHSSLEFDTEECE